MSLKFLSINKRLTSNFFNTLLNNRNEITQLRKIADNSNKALCLNGIFPPVPTPFNSDETIAYDKFESNLQKLNKIPFRGYLVLGSNGEYVYLSKEEKVELIKKAKAYKSPEKLLLAGSGAESTMETIDLTTKLAEAGADAVLIVTPSYYKSGMNDRAMKYHFEEVANKSPVPVIIYNVPMNTGIDLSVDAIVELSHHDNIIGTKESGGDITKIGNILHRTKDQNFQVLAGSAGYLLSSLYLGCVGGMCALANVLGTEVCDLYQLFEKGSAVEKEARLLQKNLIAPNAAVTKLFGVPGLKEMMDLKGYYGGPTRAPLQKLTKEQSSKLQSTFSAAGYL